MELPFGGFRKSGYGREKGVEALDAYTATKTIVVQLLNGAARSSREQSQWSRSWTRTSTSSSWGPG